MNKKKVISDYPKDFFNEKKVFIRVDFNVPINNDLNNPSVYAQVRELMDVDSFIDHLLMTIYSGNTSGDTNREWWRP